jgi:hypothetical protein
MHSVRFTAETSADGVTERDFTLGDVTGVLWSPASGAEHAPLVLMGHGGGLHDAFASKEKTLHANPGDHRNVRWLGLDDSFLVRHLGRAGTLSTA